MIELERLQELRKIYADNPAKVEKIDRAIARIKSGQYDIRAPKPEPMPLGIRSGRPGTGSLLTTAAKRPSPWDDAVTQGQIARMLGVPLEEIDWEGELGGLTRGLMAAGAGFEEKKAEFKNTYKEGNIKQFTVRGPSKREKKLVELREKYPERAAQLDRAIAQAREAGGGPVLGEFMTFQRTPGDKVKIVNQPGATWNDLWDITPAIPESAGSAGTMAAAGALGVTNPLAMLGIGSIGAMLGKLGVEGQQLARGTQRQSLPEIMWDTGMVGGLDLAAGGATLGGKALGRRMNLLKSPSNPRLAEDFENMAYAVERSPAFKEDGGFKFTEGQAASTPFGRAREKTYGKMSDAPGLNRLEAAERSANALRAEALDPRAEVPASLALSDAAQQLTNMRVSRELAQRGLTGTPTTGGRAGQSSAADWLASEKAQNRKLYADLDRIAAREKPIFSIEGVHERLRELDAAPEYYNKEWLKEPTSPEAPPGIAETRRQILDARDLQTDYATLRKWRREADAEANWRSDTPTTQEAYARKLRQIIDDATLNPLNADDTSTYVQKAMEADARYKSFRTAMEDKQLLSFLARGGNPDELTSIISSQPERLLGPQLRTALRKNPESYRDFRREVRRQILASNEGRVSERVRRLKSQNSEAFKFLAPGDEGKEFLKLAQTLDDYYATPEWAIHKHRNNLAAQSKDLFEKFRSGDDAVEYLTAIGDETLPRKTLYSYLLDTRTSMNAESPNPMLNPKAFSRRFATLEEKGLLEKILNPEEIKVLRGIEAVARRAGPKPGDVGAALEVMSLVADMTDYTDPEKAFNAYVEFVVKGNMGAFRMRPKVGADKLRKISEDLRLGKTPTKAATFVFINTGRALMDQLLNTWGTKYGEGVSPEDDSEGGAPVPTR